MQQTRNTNIQPRHAPKHEMQHFTYSAYMLFFCCMAVIERASTGATSLHSANATPLTLMIFRKPPEEQRHKQQTERVRTTTNNGCFVDKVIGVATVGNGSNKQFDAATQKTYKEHIKTESEQNATCGKQHPRGGLKDLEPQELRGDALKVEPQELQCVCVCRACACKCVRKRVSGSAHALQTF